MDTEHNGVALDGPAVSERMRELLARAAQNHLDEQRSVEEILAGTRRRIEGMESLLREVCESELEGSAGRLDRLAGNLEAASVRFNRFDKALAELGHRTERLEHTINGVAGRIEYALAEVAERMERGLGAVDGRVDGVAGRLDGLDGRVEAVNERVPRLPEAVESLLAALHTRPDRIEIEETMSKIIETMHADVLRRLVALEETMLALAEALLHPRPEGKE